MFLLYLSTADQEESLPEISQRVSMFRLIGGDFTPGHLPYNAGMEKTVNAKGLFYNDEEARFVCTWTKVKCLNGLVDRISWVTYEKTQKWATQVALQKLDPRWIPATATEVFITNQKRAESLGEFSTRCLPRAAILIEMWACNLFGYLDLRKLPVDLTILNVANNNLKGAVCLTHLPRGFMKLNARGTLIETVIVDNQKLPHTLKEALFRNKADTKQTSVCEANKRKLDIRVIVEQCKDGKVKRLQ